MNHTNGPINYNKLPESCYHWRTNDPTFQPCGECKTCIETLEPINNDNNIRTNPKHQGKSPIHARKRQPKRVRATK